MLCVLAGWHMYRLISFKTYVTSQKVYIREYSGRYAHYSLVWYTAISGIKEVSDAYIPERQLSLGFMGQAPIKQPSIKQPPIYLYNTSEIGTPRPDWYPTHLPAWNHGVKRNAGVRRNANLNGIGLLCLLGFACLLLGTRIILWRRHRTQCGDRNLLWQFLYIITLLLLPWVLFDPRDGNYSQVLITSITLGTVGWTLPYLRRVHTILMITVFLLGFLLSNHALMLHYGKFGQGIYYIQYYTPDNKPQPPPVNAWHSWLTGLQYEK